MVDRLKVDQTAIIAGGNRFVLVSNINVPLGHLETREATENVLDRIEAFINANYTTVNNVWYEITATYSLRHRESGTVRNWVGSFNPRAGPIIHEATIFDATFKNVSQRILNLETVCANLLHFNNLESDWVFDSLHSIIFHVSGFVPQDYHILYTRNLLHGTARRRIRQVATFDLP